MTLTLISPPSGEITPLIRRVRSDRQDRPSSPSKDMKRSPLVIQIPGPTAGNRIGKRDAAPLERVVSAPAPVSPPRQLTPGGAKPLAELGGSAPPLVGALGGGIIILKVESWGNNNVGSQRPASSHLNLNLLPPLARRALVSPSFTRFSFDLAEAAFVSFSLGFPEALLAATLGNNIFNRLRNNARSKSYAELIKRALAAAADTHDG